MITTPAHVAQRTLLDHTSDRIDTTAKVTSKHGCVCHANNTAHDANTTVAPAVG